MRRALYILALMLLPLGLSAQSVKSLQDKQKKLQKELETTNKMLEQTKKDESNTMNKLQLLTENINTQKKIINTIGSEILTLEGEMDILSTRRDSLQLVLESLKRDYATLVRSSHFALVQQSPLLFLVSSENFQQLGRRVRYLQQFADFRRLQVKQIENIQRDIEQQNVALEQHRRDKQSALAEQRKQQESLARDERKQRDMLSKLKSQEQKLQKQIADQKKKVADMNKKIDEAIRKQAEQQKKKGALTKEEQLTAGGFEQNKGKLPWPADKGFISGKFGKQRHPVYDQVVVDNKGIYLQCPVGTKARAVYKGEVTSCFMVGNTYAVIIQHGNYRTVYSGLSVLSVKAGDKVDTKQSLGTIYSDPQQDNKTELYFQVYKDRDLQNPSNWIIAQ